MRILDYIQDEGKGLEHYIKELQLKGYLLDNDGHAIPHDGAARELGTGKTRQEMMEEFGLRCRVLERQGLADGIHAVRTLLKKPNVYIHKTKCARGLDALRFYVRKYDKGKGVYLDSPAHNWASHGADAFRTLALDLDDPSSSMFMLEPKHHATIREYDEFGD